jgi:hypothetical protein
MISVVIDTNVFVGGLRSAGGASREVLHWALGADRRASAVVRQCVVAGISGEELSARALAAWDTENHFRALAATGAATGDVSQALAILDRLDAEDRNSAQR